jgi:Na+-driven multidrug efflux pump
MADNGDPCRNSWRRLIVGAPLTFALFFTAGIVLDWRSKPIALNIASSLLDATFFTIGFAVLDRLFSQITRGKSRQSRDRDKL